jgi:hypothetical protein
VPLAIPAGNGGAVALSILSMTMGLANYGAFYEDIVRGLAGGDVLLGGANITAPPGGWRLQVGLQGEALAVWSPNTTGIPWNASVAAGTGRPLTWWRATFATPPGVLPLAFDFTGLGKGYAYINGNGVGRFWNITAAGSCAACADLVCDYRGVYFPEKCQCDCGVPSQQYYHVPRDWLQPVGSPTPNLLVLVDELGATNPATVGIVQMD